MGDENGVGMLMVSRVWRGVSGGMLGEAAQTCSRHAVRLG